MIIISHDYKLIKRPDMSDNFIIAPEFIKRVWDIDDNTIGISFAVIYDKYEYRISLEDSSKSLLAKDILRITKEDAIEDTIIYGDIKKQ
jgi:hypothetical protein